MLTASSHNMQLLRCLWELAEGGTTGLRLTLQCILHTASYVQGTVAACRLQARLLLLMAHAKSVSQHCCRSWQVCVRCHSSAAAAGG